MASGSKSAWVFSEGMAFCPISYAGTWRIVTTSSFNPAGAGDQVILVGCSDSFIRGISDLYFSDDGLPISSNISFGPIRLGLSEAMLVTQLQTILGDPIPGLVDDDWYASVTLQASNDSSNALDNPTNTRNAVFAKPRRQVNQNFRIRGRDVICKVVNDSLDHVCSIEQIYVVCLPAGQVR